MNNFDQKTIDDAMGALPESLTRLLESTENIRNIEEIADKNGLSETEKEQFFDELTWFMIGLTGPEKLFKAFMRDFNMPKELAKLMIVEINNNIFRDSSTDLKVLYGIPKTRPLFTFDDNETSTPSSKDTMHDALPSREDVLRGIENPSAIPTPPPLILPPGEEIETAETPPITPIRTLKSDVVADELLEQKLKFIVSVPREHKDMNALNKPLTSPPRQYDTDPYRENP